MIVFIKHSYGEMTKFGLYDEFVLTLSVKEAMLTNDCFFFVGVQRSCNRQAISHLKVWNLRACQNGRSMWRVRWD